MNHLEKIKSLPTTEALNYILTNLQGFTFDVPSHNLPTISYTDLTDFQGNLKDLSEENFVKGVCSMLEKGFFVPFFVWKNKGVNNILDGHQRFRILSKLNANNHELPFVEIQAKNLKDAKEKLLAISSQYGKVTKDGFDEFAADLSSGFIGLATTFDNMLDFGFAEEKEENELDYSDKNKEIDFDENEKSQIILNYTSEEFIKVKTALSQIASTPEQAVYNLLFNE